MKPAELKILLSKEKLEKDVINRIRWDTKLNTQDFSIRYLDRMKNTLAEVPYTAITIDGDFFKHEESQIPMHRIREIRYKGEVVWAKRRK